MDEEMRFVCKLCDKRFKSGKSLGGHMRAHVIVTDTAVVADADESDDKFDDLNGYGLRENPKRSWRASSSSALTLPNEQVCKQCGKVFQSKKALCGHLACHSRKDRRLKDCNEFLWVSENIDQEGELVDDSRSDNEEDTEENEQQDPAPVCVTRTKLKRYKKVVAVKPSSFSLTNSYSNHNNNYNYGSSSVSDIDEFRQREVAMCLMMLSKDSASWAGGVHSVFESLDNSRVGFETKSSSVDMKNSRKECNLDKNDSVENGIKQVESDISVERLLRDGVKSFNYKDLSYEEKQEIRRNLFLEFGYDSSLNKRIRDDEGSYKRNKFECLNCNKTFRSSQGLGGHRQCCRKTNAFNSGGNSLECEFPTNQKAKFEKKKKPKEDKVHECAICFRIFKSGQALGGHKRSHFINGSEDRFDHMAAMEHTVETYTDMIDLNLPAPEED